MQLCRWLRIGALAAAASFCAQGQNAPGANPAAEAKGMTPRTNPSDYQASGQAGAVTIAAEFGGHSVPTLDGPLTSDEYIVLEIALYGPPGARATISSADFSLGINGKKPVPSQPFVLVGANVKDPEWEPPEKVAAAKKAKTSMNAGAGDGSDQEEKPDPNAPPPEVKIPVPVQRGWAQRVQRVALPEGDRPLPQAGALFFQYRGKIQNISSLQLVYAGPAGKATLSFKP